MSLEGSKILVTGGAGFIGSHLVDRLIEEKPSNIVIVDNFSLGKESNLGEARLTYPQLKIYHQDASDYEVMKDVVESEGIQVVFNLAVVPLPASLVYPRRTYKQNIDITLCLCELGRSGYFDTLIHFSSSEAYGSCQYAPMDENHPLNPTTPYGASKAATDLLVLSYVRAFGIDASIIRPFNNYGPRQNEGNYAGVVPLTIRRILSGEAPVIYGDGEQTRDYIYVTETADASVEIYNCKASRGKVVNIASGREISINRLVELILEYMDCGRAIIYESERPADVRKLVANTDLIQDLINFKPRINLEEGIKRTIDWYRGI